MRGYRKLRNIVLNQLRTKLASDLKYHGFHHTMDVLHVCNQYIRRNGMSGRDAHLLRIGAIVHDMGFLHTYTKHEEEGVRMMRPMMKGLGFSNADIKAVAGLIMATKVPQNPKTELEKMLCDSDLDYLGRDDFDEISESLFQELKSHGVLKSRRDWDQIQVRFLEKHHYHTSYAKKYRKPGKEKRLLEIKKRLG